MVERVGRGGNRRGVGEGKEMRGGWGGEERRN